VAVAKRSAEVVNKEPILGYGGGEKTVKDSSEGEDFRLMEGKVTVELRASIDLM